MRHYPKGQTIELFSSFRERVVDTLTGAITHEPYDPTNLELETVQGGTTTTYTYDPGPVVRLMEGSFTLSVLPASAGVLTYQWKGDGVATPRVSLRIVD